MSLKSKEKKIYEKCQDFIGKHLDISKIVENSALATHANHTLYFIIK